MRITAITESLAPELRKLQGAKRVSKDIKASAVPKDSSTISSKAQGLNQSKGYNEVVAAQVAIQPDIRPDKIAEVREKISNGYYNSEEFVDKLADKLMEEFGLGKELK